jgi:hypothetical protein
LKPDFIGVYPGRTGTAWTHNCLMEHPQLCVPYKTINYFNDESNFARGDEWYESLFRTCSPEQVKGEVSLYLVSEVAAQRIFEYHPAVKVVLFLRNPVDRAFAAYENELSAGMIPSTMRFEEAVKKRSLWLQRGFYYEAVKRFLDLFPREQILIRVYEDGVRDPKRYIREMFEFLGVDPEFEPSMLHEWVSSGGIPRASAVTNGMNGVAEQMRRLGLQNLIWLIKRTGLVKAVHTANRKSAPQPITDEKRAELEAFFADDITATGDLLNIDLTGWHGRGRAVRA